MKPDNKTIGIAFVGLGVLLIIILALVMVNFNRQAVFLCEAVSFDPNKSMADCPAHKSNISWLLMAGFGISFLVFGTGAYLIFSGKEDKKTRKKEFAAVDTSRLDQDEKKIYDTLKKSEGSMYQSDLIKETGLSKVKVTRLLDKLEHSSCILERKRRGMANIVVLK